MKVVRSFEELGTAGERICIAIGVFDGVHRGHQSVLRAAIEDAQGVGGTAVVLTFDPHPVSVLAPAKAPPLLSSTEHKLALIETLGVPVCLLVKFNLKFADLEPDQFLDLLFQSAKNLQTICVGHAFRFGRNRKGSVQTILTFGEHRGVRVDVLPPVMDGTEVISSTTTRKAVALGDLTKAERMLGRPFSVLGKVEAGEQIGRELGFPTANVELQNELLPPDGVYAVRARLGDKALGGVANVGVRPTVSAAGTGRRLEVHLFEFSGDLYGKPLEVSFVRKLRDERKFGSRDELKSQIAQDVGEAQETLAAKGSP